MHTKEVHYCKSHPIFRTIYKFSSIFRNNVYIILKLLIQKLWCFLCHMPLQKKKVSTSTYISYIYSFKSYISYRYLYLMNFKIWRNGINGTLIYLSCSLYFLQTLTSGLITIISRVWQRRRVKFRNLNQKFWEDVSTLKIHHQTTGFPKLVKSPSCRHPYRRLPLKCNSSKKS